MITALIAITGIAAGLLVAVLWIEVPSWLLPAGKGAAALKAAESPTAKPLTGARKWAAPLNAPVARWTPAGMMRAMEADVYWAHFMGIYTDWTAGQFMAVRVGGALAMLIAGTIVLQNLMLGAGFAFAIWMVVPMTLHGTAEATRKKIRSQLPEFVQLISSSMSAGVSLEEALTRASRVDNLAGRWTKKQVEASAGRMLLGQLQRGAQESRLTELITFAVQLEFVSKGTNQQDLMDMLSTMMAQEFVAKANERAQSVSTTLTVQAGLFFFVPFMLWLLIILAGPMISSLMG